MFVGEAIGFADLAEDFGFAEEEGVKPGGNAEEMTNGVLVVVVIERNAQDIRADSVKLAEKRGKTRRALVRCLRRDSVDFAAVAGGEDERFFEEAAGAEFVGGAASLFGGEGDALAELERSGAMI